MEDVAKTYKKYPKCFKQDNKKIPYILQKRNSNSPFILKGQNFNTENMLPPNFGLEDVFLRNEQQQQQQHQQQQRKMIYPMQYSRNSDIDSNDGMIRNQLYIRHFHTSDGARNRNINKNISSLDPYRDSPPYIQHSCSSDFLGI